MDFTFKGFEPGLPVGVYLLILLLSVGLAWWSYRGYKTIKPLSRYGLTGLRSIVFFILLLLLMNPLFEFVDTSTIPPKLTVLLDNSQSVNVEKGRYSGADTYRQALNQLNIDNRSNINISNYAFGKQVTPVRPDTLDYDAPGTNLFAALNHIKQNESETDAAILFTDGIYTVGQDPSYLLRTLEVPVYVVGLGDTVSVNDLIVKDVISSDEGFTNTSHPVETTIINDGFSGETITVQILSADQVVASKTLVPDNSKSAHTLQFELPLQEEGLHQYTVKIPEKSGEWTDANNERTFTINVRNKKDRVLHLAFEIHPDVKTMRSILNTDQNISLIARSWIDETRFIGGALPSPSDTLDLVILHGYPHGDIPSSLNQQIEKLTANTPVLFVRTPRQEITAIPSAMSALLPVSASSPVNSFRSSIYPAPDQRSHPITELPAIDYETLPDIKAPVQKIKATAGATSLLNISYQGSQTNVPFIAVQQIGNQRSSIINGFGFYKMHQDNEQLSRKFITELVHNIVTWTASDTDTQLLRVEPTQQVFDGAEDVKLDAFLKNESGEREPNATVNITLNSKGNTIREKQYTMKNSGSGRYSLNLGTLPEGIYEFQATARKENRVIDTHEGELSVAPTRIEYVNTTRNDPYLKQVAEQTGGKFYDFSSVSSLWKDLKKSGVLAQNKKRETSTYYPYRHITWFILVVFLLGVEWLLRKYYALP